MSKLARIALALLVSALAPAWCAAQDCVYASITVDFVAGQHHDAGSIQVSSTEAELCVSFQASDDWRLAATHLAFGASLSDLPTTKSGNPRPGQFPYAATHDPVVSEYTYCVPYASGGRPVYIATHAEVVRVDEESGNVVQAETAWGGDQDFPGRNWATYFVYQPGCIEND